MDIETPTRRAASPDYFGKKLKPDMESKGIDHPRQLIATMA